MKIVEKRAIEILSNYNGANNQILVWKSVLNSKKVFIPTRAQSDYIIKYHDVVPKVAKKYINIFEGYGELIAEQRRLLTIPKKFWVEKLLCETDKAYHIWGKILDTDPMSAIWLPKSAILYDEKKLNREIDYSKYDRIRPVFPHQKPAIEKLLAYDRFILADEMGLGKTSTAIIASLEGDFKKVLIICPASLKINWKREIEMYTDKKVKILEGNKWGSSFDYYIINYDILKNYHSLEKNDMDNNILTKEKFDLVIIDESHYVSNNSALRTKLLNNIVKDIPKRWLLTGTPITSRPMNFYNLLQLVDHPLTLSWEGYVKRYCRGFRMNVNGRKIWRTSGASNLDELRERTKNVVLRRLKTDVLDLPEKIIETLYLELNNLKYNSDLDEFIKISEDEINKESINITLNRLVKVRQTIALEKLPYTCELIDSFLDQDKKVIVFTNFTMPLDILQEKYQKICVTVDGRMDKLKRQKSVDRFQNDPKIKLFIGNIIAAGVGLTLTEAEGVIMNDLSFVPAHHDQAEDRCLWAGQLLLTSDGYKKIENINVGDLVYTHNGYFKEVFKTTSHVIKDKYKVDIKSFGFSDKLVLTNDHKVYVYNRKTNNFEWIEASKIDILNHFLTFKIKKHPKERKEFLDVDNYVDTTFKNNLGTYQKNGRLYELPDKVELTNELLYAFGFFIAEGWAIDNDKSETKKSSTVNVCQKIESNKMYDASVYIINIIKKSFKIDKHSEYINEKKCKTCTIYSKNLSKNFITWFGSGSINKKIPDWADELNDEQLIHLLDGYYHGDGYQRKNTQQMITVSSLLASQLVRYNINLGRGVSLSVRDVKSQNKNYIVEYSLLDKNIKSRIHSKDGYMLYPITSIFIKRPKKTDNKVYDISVKDDQSFVVGCYNVHNCHRIGTKKSVLVYYPIFENSIEMIIYNILEKKRNIIDQIIGDGEYSESFGKELIKELKKDFKIDK